MYDIFLILMTLVGLCCLAAAIICFAKPGNRFQQKAIRKRGCDPVVYSTEQGLVYISIFISCLMYVAMAYLDPGLPGLWATWFWVILAAVLVLSYRLIRKRKQAKTAQ